MMKAFEFRMEALRMLMSKPGGLGPDMPSPSSAGDGYDSYLLAAAREPLIEYSANELGFDRERFRARVLGIKG